MKFPVDSFWVVKFNQWLGSFGSRAFCDWSTNDWRLIFHEANAATSTLGLSQLSRVEQSILMCSFFSLFIYTFRLLSWNASNFSTPSGVHERISSESSRPFDSLAPLLREKFPLSHCGKCSADHGFKYLPNVGTVKRRLFIITFCFNRWIVFRTIASRFQRIIPFSTRRRRFSPECGSVSMKVWLGP